MSNVLKLDHLPVNTESSFASTLFGRDMLEKIKEIYTHPHGSTSAWVVFKTPEDAQYAAARYDNYHFGPTGQKMATSLCLEDTIPTGDMNLLTEFRHKLENQLESSTVKITNLPENHTGRSLNLLLDPVLEEFDMHVPDDDPYYGSFEPDEIIHSTVLKDEPGAALVQLKKPNMAKSIVHRFAGTYWKNATLNACCVPDEEIEELLAKRRDADAKDMMLFVTGIKANTSANQVREIFKDFPLRDINIPSGGKGFCFIFMRPKDADSALARFGKGVLHEGKLVRVRVSDKNKKNGQRTGTRTGNRQPTPLFATTDLKINNLPYGVTFGIIQNIFQGFDLTKVVIKEGYAFVGIMSAQAEFAVQMLNGSMVGDRTITVKVAEGRK